MKVMTKESKLYLVGLAVLLYIMVGVTREVSSWDMARRLTNIEGSLNTLNFLLEENLYD